MLPCALCRAPRQKTHGKGFVVRFMAFAVRSGRTAKPLFPVVIGISVTTYLLERSITTFFIVLIYFNFLETHYPATQGWEGVIIWNCQAVNLAPRELMGPGRKCHLGYNLFIVYLVLS
jgi:hypothetical protein